jgi:hypothetical protein
LLEGLQWNANGTTKFDTREFTGLDHVVDLSPGDGEHLGDLRDGDPSRLLSIINAVLLAGTWEVPTPSSLTAVVHPVVYS